MDPIKTAVLRNTSPVKPNAVNSEAEMHAKGKGQKFLYGKQVALEETVKNLHEQVACLLCECNAKDRLMAEHVKTAQEANSGRERAESLVAIQKQELENVLQQKAAAIERLIDLNAALKKCRRELSSLKMERDRRVMLEKAHKKLESKYIEARKKLANLTVENARLTKALVKKEEIIFGVNNQISEATAKFKALVSRLDSTEKGNNVLKHEYCLLRKELKIKNRQAVVANRQQLETERQKLRLLMKKRAPGHPKTNPKDQNSVDTSFITKQLIELEEENRILKESACKRDTEIQDLKAELARMKRDEQNNSNLVMNEMNDDFENLNIANYDLDHQLSAAKVQLKEALHEISLLEMELEDKIHRCQRLETTCFELQLQLTSKDVETEVHEQEEKLLLQTGLKITTELTHHSSLHDLITSDVVVTPPTIKEMINATETEESSIVVRRSLPVVPVKKRRKHTELLRRLLFRVKRGGNKKKLIGVAAFKFL